MLLRSSAAHSAVVDFSESGAVGSSRGNGSLLLQRGGGVARQAPQSEPQVRRANDIGPDWAAAWMLDTQVGRMMIDSDCRLLWASASAMSFLGADMPLALRFGCLVAVGQANQARLTSLVADAASAKGRIDGLFSAGGGAPTIAVQARRAPGSDGHLAIQLRDLEGDLESDLPDLVSLYGLTRMEHRIVCLLLNGLSGGEIAARLNKSILTVRTHLKRTYAKLGISTKEQLFSRILRLA